MAKLDFNLINQPVLELTMMDEAKTAITVTSPAEGLVEELQDTVPELQNILKAGNETSVAAAYNLAARLMSCNRQGLQVTAEDLKTKYWPKDRYANLLNLVYFVSAYLDFIHEIENAKN